MLKSRLSLIAITLGVLFLFLIFKVDYLVAAICTLLIIVLGYIFVSTKRSRKRLALLEEECDPDAFLESTHNQREITGKNLKFATYFDIDKAAGWMNKGEFEKAKQILLSLNKKYLSPKNGTLLIYTINLMGCLYELGEIEEAENLFASQIPGLVNKNALLHAQIDELFAERLFFLKEDEECKKHYEKFLKTKLTPYKKAGTLYRLAQLDERAGDLNSAKEKYRQVAESVPKLWIGKKAQAFLSQV